MRSALTTKSGKSKCLKYRNSKRCGRLGRYLVKGVTPDPHGQGRHSHFSYPVCEECKEALLTLCGEVVSFSPKGYTVKESLFGPVSREYKPIQLVCANCERTVVENGVDKYCSACGPGAVEMDDPDIYEAEELAYEDRTPVWKL